MSLRRNIKTQQDLDSSCGFYWLDANLTSRCIKPACWPHLMSCNLILPDLPQVISSANWIKVLTKSLDNYG